MPTAKDAPYQSSHELTPYIRGACELTVQPDGLVLPRRFFPEQTAHFEAIGRGERAIATAGIVVDFVTDGTEVYLDCNVVRRLNPDHELYQQVMAGGANDGARPFGSAEEGNVDGIDIVVDGRMLATVAPMTGTLRFAFENSTHDDIEVRIYLPSIMAVSIGNLRTNGSLKPVPERGYLLALGDSITQGFICGNPSAAYPAQIARILGLDLLNQAVSHHVFDEGSLGGFSRWRDETPEVIVVAYGTNDWAEKRSAEVIEQDAVAYLDRLSRMFPKVPTYVLSPLWRTDEHDPKPCGFPLTWMNQVLGRACSRHPNMHVVDGYHGIPKDPDLYADASVHPGPECMGLVADLLLESMCADSVDLTVARHVAKRTMRETARFVGGFVSREELIDRDTAQRAESPEAHPEFDRVVRTIWRLRQADGCPWDKSQTHESIAKNLVEEAYEVIEAIGAHDEAQLAEELGDVLMQVLLHAQIADDEGSFDIDDICRLLNEKLVRRHPHVFGDEVSSQADSPEEVLRIWDAVKKEEGEEKKAGLLDSVPRSLPALMQAQKISKRAAKAGFEWDTVEDVWDKVREEREEFEREVAGSVAAAEEFGDMLFALVNVARHCGIDAEEALAASNAKFRRRWEEMERRGDVDMLDTFGLNRLWDEVKRDLG